MLSFLSAKTRPVSPAEALPGRAQPIATAREHFVNGRKLAPPYPAGIETAIFGMGCFWGAERKFWQAGRGRVGDRGRLCRRLHRPIPPMRRRARAAPATPRRCWSPTIPPRSPTRRCSRSSGRTTTRPRACARAMTSARSTARRSTRRRPSRPRRRAVRREMFGAALKAKGLGAITTEIAEAGPFYFAEGLPPAISGQESRRLLRPRRHRRLLPDRHRQGVAAERATRPHPNPLPLAGQGAKPFSRLREKVARRAG